VQFNLASGDYTLKLTGLTSGDINVIGGGFDAYYVNNSSQDNGMWYQFLTIKVISSGDTITFLENGVGANHNIGPGSGTIPVGYNKGWGNFSEGQLDRILFSDGSSWDHDAIWQHLSPEREAWAYAVGDNTHGFGR
jgi:hypothetical protein